MYSASSFERVLSYDFGEEVCFLQFCPLQTSPSLLLCVGASGRISFLLSSEITCRLLNGSTELRSLQLTDIILDVSLSGELIAVATCNGVRFFSWDMELVKRKDYPFHVKSRFSAGVSRLACSLNPQHTFYLISDVNTIYEVDYRTDEIHRSYNGHHGTVWCLRYSPDGNSFISGSDDSSIRLWTAERN